MADDPLEAHRRQLYREIQDLKAKLVALEVSKQRLEAQRRLTGATTPSDGRRRDGRRAAEAETTSQDRSIDEELNEMAASCLAINKLRLTLVGELRKSYASSKGPHAAVDPHRRGAGREHLDEEFKLLAARPPQSPQSPGPQTPRTPLLVELIDDASSIPLMFDRFPVSSQPMPSTFKREQVRIPREYSGGFHPHSRTPGVMPAAVSLMRQDSMTIPDMRITHSNAYEAPRVAPPPSESRSSSPVSSHKGSRSSSRSSDPPLDRHGRSGSQAWVITEEAEEEEKEEQASARRATPIRSPTPSASPTRKYNLSDDLIRYRSAHGQSAARPRKSTASSMSKTLSINKALPALHPLLEMAGDDDNEDSSSRTRDIPGTPLSACVESTRSLARELYLDRARSEQTTPEPGARTGMGETSSSPRRPVTSPDRYRPEVVVVGSTPTSPASRGSGSDDGNGSGSGRGGSMGTWTKKWGRTLQKLTRREGAG